PLLTRRPPPRSSLFPYTTLFRSELARRHRFAAASRLLEDAASSDLSRGSLFAHAAFILRTARSALAAGRASEARSALARVPIRRSEEHTSELQSRENLVCRLLLE